MLIAERAIAENDRFRVTADERAELLADGKAEPHCDAGFSFFSALLSLRLRSAASRGIGF
jgi:hypothetical protein